MMGVDVSTGAGDATDPAGAPSRYTRSVAPSYVQPSAYHVPTASPTSCTVDVPPSSDTYTSKTPAAVRFATTMIAFAASEMIAELFARIPTFDGSDSNLKAQSPVSAPAAQYVDMSDVSAPPLNSDSALAKNRGYVPITSGGGGGAATPDGGTGRFDKNRVASRPALGPALAAPRHVAVTPIVKGFPVKSQPPRGQ